MAETIADLLAVSIPTAGADVMWIEQSGLPRKITMTELDAEVGSGGGTPTDITVASEVMETGFSKHGSLWMSLMISLSALGAINGMIFTGARISYAMGSEHQMFSFLGKWNHKLGTPSRALAVEAGITIFLLLLFSLYRLKLERK